MSTDTVFGEVDTGTPTLKLAGVVKQFGRVTAVNNVSMEVRRNEVVGLIGENGAGKSSLLKILTGIHQPDRGTIEVNGKPVDFRRPQDATAAGIGVVHRGVERAASCAARSGCCCSPP
jgi:ribose transport system ATP-binding protein